MNLRIIFLLLLFPFHIFAQQFGFTIEDSEGCNSLTTRFINTSLDTVHYTYEWSWAGNASVLVTNVNANFSVGTHPVSMTVKDLGNNLVIVVRDTVIVHQNPNVSITSDKVKVCDQDPVLFSIDSIVAEGAIAEYKWVFGDGTVSSKAIPDPHSYYQVGTYKTSVIVEDVYGCSSGQSNLIEVSVASERPSASFTADKFFSCADSLLVNFTDASIAYPGRTITSYLWDFGDETVVSAKDTSYLFRDYGSNKVSLTVVQDNGCTSTANKYIMLSEFKVGFKATDAEKPFVDLTEQGALNACLGDVTFSSTGTVALNYMWDIGNDSVIEHQGVGSFYSTLQYRFDTSGVYPVRLYASNSAGCEAWLTDTIVVEEPISLSFLNDVIYSCDTQDVHILTVELSSLADTITWLLNGNTPIGDNAASIQTKLQQGIHSLTVQAVSKNVCHSFLTVDSFAEVLQPKGYFYDVSRLSGCVPLSVDFSGSYTYDPQIGIDSVVGFEWDLDGDGTADALGVTNVSHTYENTGSNYVRLKVTTAKGCVSYSSFTVYTGDTAMLDFAITPDVCTWQDAEFVQLTDLQTNSFADTVWYMVYSADDTTRIANAETLLTPPGSTHALHFDDTTGVFNLRMMASNHGCHSTWLYADSVITVRGPIVFIDKLFDCETPYDYRFFTSKLVDADSISWNIFKYETAYPYNDITKPIPAYSLTASDYSKTDTLYHTFLARGDYKIEVIANNYKHPECADTSIIEWLPVRDLAVDFALTSYESCLGDILVFDNAQTLAAQDMIATKLTWNIAQGRDSLWLFSTENENNIRYASSFLSYGEKGDVKLTVHAKDLNGCIDSASKMVRVYQPEAKFLVVNSSNCLPYSVQLIDSTVSRAGIAQRFWTTYGDTNAYIGNDSIIVDIISTQGVRSPSLTVVDSFGCRASFVAEDAIVPIVPDSRFALVNEKICVGGKASVQLVNDGDKNYTFPADSIVWHIDDEYYQTTLDSALPESYLCDSSRLYKISAMAYVFSQTGMLCSHSDSLVFQAKDMKIRMPFDGTNICKNPFDDALFNLDDGIYDGFDDVKSIKWYVDDVYKPTVFYAKNIRLDKEGAQELKMVVESEYDGCEVMQDSIDVFVYNTVIDLKASKEKICIGEDITYTVVLANTDFFKTVPHYWLPGDGTRIDGSDGSITYKYTKLPEGEPSVNVSFIVDENAQENSACKSIKISQTIGIYPIDVDFRRAGNDSLLKGCAPFNVEFLNTSVGTDNQYQWVIDTATLDATNASYVFAEPGKKYPVTLHLLSNTCPQKKTDTVYTYPDPDVSLQVQNTVVCDYETVHIYAGGNYEKVNSWEYNGQISAQNDTVITAVFENDSKVAVTVESADGCIDSDSILIQSVHKPQYAGAPEGGLSYHFLADSIMILTGEKARRIVANGIFNFNNIASDGVMYRWEPFDYLSCSDCASPTIDLSCGEAFPCTDIPDSIVYTLYMTDSLGCFVDVSKQIVFEIIKKAKLGMPKAFSPNGDGVNDIAYARGWATTQFIGMQIFNRWGQIVFETAEISKGWDGTMGGKPQKAGAYAYVIRALDETNTEIVVKGYITLMR